MEQSRFRITSRSDLPEPEYFAGTRELLLVGVAGAFIGAAVLIGALLWAGVWP